MESSHYGDRIRFASKAVCCFLCTIVLLHGYLCQAQTADDEAQKKYHGSRPLHVTMVDFCKRIESIDTLTEKERRSIPEESRAIREQLKQILEDGLESDDLDVQCYASYLLGQFRMDDAAMIMAHLITLEDKVNRQETSGSARNSQWWWGRFPVAEAWVNMGGMAANAALGNLSVRKDSTGRLLSLWVIYCVCRKDINATRRLLKQDLLLETLPEAKANVQLAITYLNTHDPDHLLDELKR